MGLKGVNTNADPQNEGLPDLGDPHWDPMWEACADLGLPLNFHIGASIQQSTYFGTTPWPSHGDDEKLALGSAMMYLGNARILSNLIYSGILERHPTLNGGLGGERHRLGALRARGARLPGPGDRTIGHGPVVDEAVGVLPPADLRLLLVRVPRAWFR